MFIPLKCCNNTNNKQRSAFTRQNVYIFWNIWERRPINLMKEHELVAGSNIKSYIAKASPKVKISWWYNIVAWPVLLGESERIEIYTTQRLYHFIPCIGKNIVLLLLIAASVGVLFFFLILFFISHSLSLPVNYSYFQDFALQIFSGSCYFGDLIFSTRRSVFVCSSRLQILCVRCIH